MKREIILKAVLVLLSGFLFQCKSNLNVDLEEAKDSTFSKPVIDSAIIILPDTIKYDTAIIGILDSVLSVSPQFGTENIYNENQLVIRTGIYSNANDFIGTPTSLAYNFVAPQSDTMKYRPFILFLHEGAFIYGNLTNELGKAKLMSRKGYAAASIDYRLGFHGGSESNACGGDNKELFQAIYRSVQDTYSALYYFTNHANDFGIDPGQIILAGSSAGGIAISAFLYMQEADFEKLNPGISKVLGKLNPYPVGRPYKIKALLSSLGYAVIQKSYITINNAKPSLFFQRSGDDILAFANGPLFYCPGYFNTDGAKNVSERLKELKIPYELNYEPLKGHQIGYPEKYITDRYAMFMKRLWGNNLRQITNENYTIMEDIVIK